MKTLVSIKALQFSPRRTTSFLLHHNAIFFILNISPFLPAFFPYNSLSPFPATQHSTQNREKMEKYLKEKDGVVVNKEEVACSGEDCNALIETRVLTSVKVEVMANKEELDTSDEVSKDNH
ncbi:hypothetical protein HanIR_Chr05g0244121 [Helianthus annuus]|nr:hypothetical protein HanIR_Chr05g0244121 [Helianthus annuus]